MAPGFRFDLHVHTEHSDDARGTVMELAHKASEVGLHGFAVTDHNTVAGHAHIDAAAQATGQIIIPGIELSTASGHLLGFGIDKAPPKGLPLRDAIERIRHMGGVAIPSHPLRMWTGIGPTDLRDGKITGHIHAAEAVNARDRPLLRDNVARLITELEIPGIGGSDAHQPDEIGTCWTHLDARIRSVEDVLKALRQGSMHGEGGFTGRARIWKHRGLMATRRV